jgi:hypothetical protein
MAIRRSLEWDTTFKRVATLLSASAAIISIFSFMAGRRATRHNEEMIAAGLAAMDVERIDILPAADTAYSLGDTLYFATTAADAHGQLLRAATVHWTVDDPTVVQMDSMGQAVARAPGVTSVTVAIGGRAGRARIWVLPRLTAISIEGDSVIRVAEAGTLTLHALGADARGHTIPAGQVSWGSADAEVASIDSTGALRGLTPGSTTVTATSAGFNSERRVEVVPVPSSITITSGAEQRAAVGQRLAAPISVQVVSRSGRPVANTVVHFDPTLSAGKVEPDSAATDSHGLTTVRWTLGPVPGRQRLAIQVPGIDSAVMVPAEADPTPKNTKVVILSDSLSAESGMALTEPVAIEVTDSTGAALADLPVAWTTLDGGSLSLASARTDSTGVARAHWHLGPRAGTQRVKVQVGNPRTLPPVILKATALAGPAASLKVVSGDAQRGATGAALTKGVLLRVTDSLGNPLGGVPLHLHPKQGEIDSLVHTGADGRASVRWTMPETVGPARLIVRLGTRADSVTVTAMVQAGPAATIAVTAPATGTTGKALPKPVQVVVKDRYGNLVPGVTVKFAVATGKLTPLSGVTDSTGTLATRWTLGPKSGKQTITASIKAPALRASRTVDATATGAAPAAAAKTTSKTAAPKPATAKAPAAKAPATKPKATSGADSSPKPFGVN